MAKKPTEFTKAKNLKEALRNGILKADGENYTGSYSSERRFAACGCCTSGIYPQIEGVGKAIWSQKDYAFLNQVYEYKDEYLSVHPSLWNNGTNNVISGIFEVLPGRIYQARGYDMANMTFVKSNAPESETVTADSQWLVMDTLMSCECTEMAMKDFEVYLAGKFVQSQQDFHITVSCIIVSHSHVDHFGGVDVVKRQCKDGASIYAPEGFLKHSVSENIYAGNAMSRRAAYQYGTFIRPETNGNSQNIDGTGSISIGIGQGQSLGTVSFCPATEEIAENCTRHIGDLEVEFQLTPGTEAPAEMNCYFRQYAALWLAENCNGSLHNLYTLRGAQIRDGSAWAKYLVEAAERYASYQYGNQEIPLQVIFQSHNWPHWAEHSYEKADGSQEVVKMDLKEFILDTASIYKYINDQTLLYMNEGYKMNEVSDMLTLPKSLQKNWCLKPFYGTPKHNAKAVYQKYLGWYDANPIHLAELPPEQLAKEQLRYMTDQRPMEAKIQEDYDAGNYWTAAYMAHQIILGSEDEEAIKKAKELCADALIQLGYQAESGTWRNAYLSAANELQNKKGRVSTTASSTGNALVMNMTSEMILDYMAILYDGDKTSEVEKVEVLMEITDKETQNKEYFKLHIRNGVLLYWQSEVKSGDMEQIKVTRDQLFGLIAATQTKGTAKELVEKLKALNVPEPLIGVACAMTNLAVDRFKYFDIIGRHDSEVQVDEVYYDLKKTALDCITMLEGYYETMKNTKNNVLVSLNGSSDSPGTDLYKWIQEYYPVLKTETGVLSEDTTIQQGNDGTAGIGSDGQFRKYEYVHTLYELYRYLVQPYVKNDWTISGTKEKGAFILNIRKEIELVEPYFAKFYDKWLDDAGVLGFEDSDREAWKWYYSHVNTKNGKEVIPDGSFFEVDRSGGFMGVGDDGYFHGRELLHLLYQLYKTLYESLQEQKQQ